MKGIVKFYSKKKGFGFIYGYGSQEVNGKEKLIPEYFFHFSELKSRNLRSGDMVRFTPTTTEKGLVATNVRKKKYRTEDDPRGFVAMSIWDEFDIKIPCIAWLDFLEEDMQELYNYLKAEEEHNEAELERITEKYGLNDVPEEDKMICITDGGYDWYMYYKKQREKYENGEY